MDEFFRRRAELTRVTDVQQTPFHEAPLCGQVNRTFGHGNHPGFPLVQIQSLEKGARPAVEGVVLPFEHHQTLSGYAGQLIELMS